jgi:hypothetical protein
MDGVPLNGRPVAIGDARMQTARLRAARACADRREEKLPR